MLAMPSFDDYVELLDVALTHEKKPVTVKWLSRQISVNVNQAKRILKSYIDAKEDQHFHLIYVVSGVTPDDGLKTFLVREDEVEAAKKKLKIAYTPYIYCVAPSRLKNSNSVCLVNTEAIESQEGNPSKFASIINPEVQKIDMRLSKPAVTENHAKKPVASSALRSNSNGPSNSASSSSGVNAASTASRKSSIPKKPVSKTASSFFNSFRKGSGSAKEGDNSKNKDKIIDQEKSENTVTSEKDMDVVMDEAVDTPILEKPKSRNSKAEKRKGADTDADDDIATKKNAVKKRKVIMEDDEEDEEDTHVNGNIALDELLYALRGD
ncbi:DNA polymerase subunit Cdc27 [Paraphysoderma sedebokerense]|nr:DNA polymerase subunit Cdc27 [Paraphysoderma sedebokerense]